MLKNPLYITLFMDSLQCSYSRGNDIKVQTKIQNLHVHIHVHNVYPYILIPQKL